MMYLWCINYNYKYFIDYNRAQFKKISELLSRKQWGLNPKGPKLHLIYRKNIKVFFQNKQIFSYLIKNIPVTLNLSKWPWSWFTLSIHATLLQWMTSWYKFLHIFWKRPLSSKYPETRSQDTLRQRQFSFLYVSPLK